MILGWTYPAAPAVAAATSYGDQNGGPRPALFLEEQGPAPLSALLAGPVPFDWTQLLEVDLVIGTGGQIIASLDQLVADPIFVAATARPGVQGAKVVRTTGQSLPNGVSTPIQFTASSFEYRGDWWDIATPTRITVPPEAGGTVVVLTVAVDFVSNASGVRSVSIRKNGATLLLEDVRGAIGAHMGFSEVATDMPVAGDYYELVCYQNIGGALFTQVGAFPTSLSVIVQS